MTIVVSDTTKPVITGTNEYTSNMSNPITEAQVRAGLTATDNVDEDLTINLVSDGFVGNEQKFGSFNIVYNVIDSAGNVSEDYIVVITTYDDIAPVITGKNEYSVSSIGKLNLDLVTKALDVSDNDGEVPTYEIVKDGYSNYTSIVGTYEVTYVARDSNGNESSPFIVNIHVIDNIPPVFFISEDILYVEDTLTLTHQQIVDGLLAQAGINPADVGEYELESAYFETPNVASVYSVRATLLMNDGSVQEIESNIEVIETEEDETIVDETDDEERTEQKVNVIKDFFNKVWTGLKNIGEFFVKLFKTITFGWLWDKDGKFDPKWNEWHLFYVKGKMLWERYLRK